MSGSCGEGARRNLDGGAGWFIEKAVEGRGGVLGLFSMLSCSDLLLVTQYLAKESICRQWADRVPQHKALSNCEMCSLSLQTMRGVVGSKVPREYGKRVGSGYH